MARNYAVLLLINFLGLILADHLLDGVYMGGYGWGLLAAALLTLLHIVLKPTLLFFTLPLTILSLGLSLLALNTLLFWLAGNVLAGFSVTSLGGAAGGALIISLLGLAANLFLLNRPGQARVFTFSQKRTNPGQNPGAARRDSGPAPFKPQPRSGAGEEKDMVIDMESDDQGQWKPKD
jgi:putative membrane protein